MKICQKNFIFQFHVLGLKLNRLKEKSASYESHKYFLSRCIRDCSIPKGLKLQLEPTLRNFDQEFINSWFSKLKDFSFDTMKDIIKFCDMTIAESKLAIEVKLKTSMEREEFSDIGKTSKENKEATKPLLLQRKFRKCNHLKHSKTWFLLLKPGK